VPVTPESAELLPGSWRRWQQGFDAYGSGDEAETFQSVGVRLRECLVSFVGETRDDELVPEGETAPKASDFKGWTELLANALAAGQSAASLRSYLKKIAVETWDYVNWLTHAKNAVRVDAEIGLKAVEHLLGTFTAAMLRLGRTMTRCEGCGSYEVVAGVCRQCEWVDPSYKPRRSREWSEEERARRLAEPCTPSSDISTFLGLDDVKG
jgi:ribosomal protein L37E